MTDKLTTAQVAAQLGCSQRTVQRVVANKELPAEVPVIGPRVALIDPSDLAAFIASRTRDPEVNH